jgi:hypothetical protein
MGDDIIKGTVSRVPPELPTGTEYVCGPPPELATWEIEILKGLSTRPPPKRILGDGNIKGTVSRVPQELSTGAEYICGPPPEHATWGMA